MGLAALISVSVPLAVAWAALGVWLGRRQERQAGHLPAAAPVETPAHAEAGAL
jgi:AAA family ATP:ADP antiporter